MEKEDLDLESFLPYRLNRLAEAVSRDFSKLYRERFGLTRPEWRTLATLGQFGRMTATAVGKHSAMHKTKVSRAVTALEGRRWLTRTPDDMDRRVEHLELTRPGTSAYRELVPIARRYQHEMLSRLTDSERATLGSALVALERANTIGRSR